MKKISVKAQFPEKRVDALFSLKKNVKLRTRPSYQPIPFCFLLSQWFLVCLVQPITTQLSEL